MCGSAAWHAPGSRVSGRAWFFFNYKSITCTVCVCVCVCVGVNMMGIWDSGADAVAGSFFFIIHSQHLCLELERRPVGRCVVREEGTPELAEGL